MKIKSKTIQAHTWGNTERYRIENANKRTKRIRISALYSIYNYQEDN